MITYIKGKMTYSNPCYTILETCGIGYKIFIPASALALLPSLGSDCQLHTSYVIRENSQTLYGFIDIEERNLFEELITISGIGPKTALSLIGHLPKERLCQAIQAEDTGMITKVPGIGKKTAERLLIEMRDKLKKIYKSPRPTDFSILLDDHPEAQKIADAVNALINLGYNQTIAQKAVKKTLESSDNALDLPKLITNALKHV